METENLSTNTAAALAPHDGGEKRGEAMNKAVTNGARPPVIRFELPKDREAHEPPELRGLRRDRVKLLVLDRRGGARVHTEFGRLGDYLRPGDLLVFNDSRTMPALLRGHSAIGEPVEVRLARPLAGRMSRDWEALLLPHGREHQGETITFSDGLHAIVGERRAGLPWLWRLSFDSEGMDLLQHVYRAGEPVRYTYVPEALPIDLYQTVYAAEPGSVEMPSAGRPFTWELLQALQRRGIGRCFITLHTGLSSFRDPVADSLRPSHEEPYRITAAAASAINAAHRQSGRIIAVGTTVVRTLETVADAGGRLRAAEGVTDLYISAAHHLRAVDGLLTGLHEPEASHLDLLSAFVTPALLAPAYGEALSRGYLWHEFGDLNLIV